MMVVVSVVPDTPHIDVAKCSRSTSSVVLVLEAPSQDTDVVDGYRVFYSTDQDRPLDAWVCLSVCLSVSLAPSVQVIVPVGIRIRYRKM